MYIVDNIINIVAMFVIDASAKTLTITLAQSAVVKVRFNIDEIYSSTGASHVINLPIKDGMIATGAYVAIIDGVETLLPYSYPTEEPNIVWNENGLLSTMAVGDNTAYLGTIVSQSIVCTPPAPLVEKTGTSSVSYDPNIYSGTWSVRRTLELYYDQGNGLTTKKSIDVTDSHIVYNTNVQALYDAVSVFIQDYIDGCSLCKDSSVVMKLNGYMELFNGYWLNGSYEKAYDAIYEAGKLVNLSSTTVEIEPMMNGIAVHIQNFNNPHKTSFSNIEGYPSTPTNNRFLRDDKTFAEIALKHSQLISPNEDVNVQHLTDAEKAELHTHTNKSMLDTITSLLVSGWNAAATWVSTYGANVLTHIADSSIHVTSTLLSTINNKVDKVAGKELSTNDFTDDYKSNGLVGTGNHTLTTLKQVADKAQFAPNENGTILYHTTKWFTPTGTISTNGTTATSTSSQFTSSMVGAKLTILGEERIITSYISGTQVNVNNSYSQNYNAIQPSNWGVYSKSMEQLTSGEIRIYTTVGSWAIRLNPNNSAYIQSYYYGDIGLAFLLDTTGLSFKSGYIIKYSSTTNTNGAKDVGITRSSAGVLEVNDGNTAGIYRDINLRNLNYYGTLNNASDERLKHNIRPVNDGLEKVCKLAECVRHFEFNNQDIYAKGQRTGFIAQLLKASGFDGHVSEREPANEEEGAIFGWTYKNEEYEEINTETKEVEIKTRRVVDVKGDMVLQVENNFSTYLYPAVAELKRQNDELRSELDLIKQKLGIL